MNITELVEATPATIGRLNRAANIIHNTTLIGRKSVNGGRGGRTYSDRALGQIAAMAEGLPCYANHTKAEDAFKVRDIKDLIGRHVNVKFDPISGKVTSDLHLIETAAPWVFSLAERLGDHIGNSLVSKGLVRQEGDGEIVDEIVALRSGDLVSDPAACPRGLFENVLSESRSQHTASVDALLARVRTGGIVPLPPGLHHQELLGSGAVIGRRTVTTPLSDEELDTLRTRLAAAVVRR